MANLYRTSSPRAVAEPATVDAAAAALRSYARHYPTRCLVSCDGTVRDADGVVVDAESADDLTIAMELAGYTPAGAHHKVRELVVWDPPDTTVIRWVGWSYRAGGQGGMRPSRAHAVVGPGDGNPFDGRHTTACNNAVPTSVARPVVLERPGDGGRRVCRICAEAVAL